MNRTLQKGGFHMCKKYKIIFPKPSLCIMSKCKLTVPELFKIGSWGIFSNLHWHTYTTVNAKSRCSNFCISKCVSFTWCGNSPGEASSPPTMNVDAARVWLRARAKTTKDNMMTGLFTNDYQKLSCLLYTKYYHNICDKKIMPFSQWWHSTQVATSQGV